MRVRSIVAGLVAGVVIAAGGIGTAAASSGSEPTSFASGTTHLAGIDRYQTSIATSANYASGVPVLFVSLGSNFPDALSAASAAAVLGGPLLLTPGESLRTDTAAEVRRLAPQQIYVTGDSRSISDGVVRALSAIAPTTRLGEIDRYETGRLIVSTAFTSASHAIIANGGNFPDALAATGAAGSRQAPVILVNGTAATAPSSTLDMIKRLGVTSVGIVGDVKSVSAGIESQLRGAGLDVARYGGSGRYETAALINDAYFPNTVDTAFITAGANFPDALSAAAVAGRIGAPIYTTLQQCLPGVIRESLTARAPRATVVMGDAKAVGTDAGNSLGCLAAGKPSISGTAAVGNTLTAQAGAWTAGTSFTYAWTVDGAAAGSSSTFAVTAAHVGKRVAVKVTGARTGYVTASAASSSTGTVPAPSRTTPSLGSCPSWAPIKGNASSMIYHVPGGGSYDKTNPEECFSTESAAVAAGYRKARN